MKPAKKVRAISIALWDGGPFAALVEHFVRRLFASEEEQTGGELGLGVGAVLALLASPGAFASILMLEKYSSLLQYLRGHFIDPIRSSPSDEYFFVVLSMTITGLVMVARWNRLLPDGRDFSNLAVLPIPIRNIFLANFIALLGLGLLFAIDVNAVSAILFPLFVTMENGPMSAFLWMIVSHFVTVMSASLFSFFAVFALVGVLMLVVPQAIFRRVSLAARVILVVVLLMEFFSNLFLQLLAGDLPGHASHFMRWLPSFWFLGVYERMMGIASPAMMHLAQQALSVLAGLIALSLGAYALCYQRTFLRRAEAPETLGSVRHYGFLRLPDGLARLLFRTPLEYAACGFAWKVLWRSEQHLMFFGAYLGIGLVMVGETALGLGRPQSGTLPAADYLAMPLMIAFFLISGLRMVFDIPAVLAANWAFQATVTRAEPEPRGMARRMILATVIPWEVALVGPLTMWHFGWRIALLHTATLIALSVFFAEFVLVRFRKIPFTCSTPLEIRQLLLRLLGSVFAVLIFVPLLAGAERWMLGDMRRFWLMTILYGACWRLLQYHRREANLSRPPLVFEDLPAPQFELMKLT